MALGIVVFGLFIYIICVLWKDKPKFIQEKMCKVLYKNIFGLVDICHLYTIFNAYFQFLKKCTS